MMGPALMSYLETVVVGAVDDGPCVCRSACHPAEFNLPWLCRPHRVRHARKIPVKTLPSGQVSKGSSVFVGMEELDKGGKRAVRDRPA